MLPIVLRSLLVSGLAVFFSALVGVPIGVWLGSSSTRTKRRLRTLIHAGMALPPVVIGLLLYLLLSRSGPLGSLGWLFTIQAMILAQFLLALPFVIGITSSAITSIPTELAQQLRGLGASSRQIRWTMLKEARAGVFLALAAAFGRSISEVGAVLIVGGNIDGHTRVMTTAIVLETGKGEFEFALMLGGVLLMIAILVNIVLFWFSAEGSSIS